MRDVVLVCGSRTWADAEQIRARLALLPRGSTVMHGCARGADQMAGTAARALGLAVVEVPADWTQGRHAGFTRNLRMLDMRPDRVLAFWRGGSGGTAHVIRNARERAIPVEVFRA